MKSLFEISGVVRKGKGRGKDFGFPTANIALEQIIPEGIYASRVIIANQTYNALTFIGAAKTFNEATYQAESYILEFNEDLYGKTITIILLKKLRDNHAFDSEQALITQMKKDVEDGLRFFRN